LGNRLSKSDDLKTVILTVFDTNFHKYKNTLLQLNLYNPEHKMIVDLSLESFQDKMFNSICAGVLVNKYNNHLNEIYVNFRNETKIILEGNIINWIALLNDNALPSSKIYTNNMTDQLFVISPKSYIVNSNNMIYWDLNPNSDSSAQMDDNNNEILHLDYEQHNKLITFNAYNSDITQDIHTFIHNVLTSRTYVQDRYLRPVLYGIGMCMLYYLIYMTISFNASIKFTP
jgi:hypothetical protein